MTPGHKGRLSLVSLTVLTLMLLTSTLVEAEVDWQNHQLLLDTAAEHVRSSPETRFLTGIQVETQPLDSRLKLRNCNQPLKVFHPYAIRASHKITVGINCNDSKPWTIFIPVQITALYEVVNLVRSLPRGTRLTRDDLNEKKVRLRPSQKPFINNIESALGKELSRSLPANTTLTHAMVRVPRIISRGDDITMIVSVGSLEVRSSGIALQDGAVGQKISLRNTKSRRKVEGWVQADGSIRVFR